MHVVLGTHVIVSALLFTTGRLAWMRRIWQRGKAQPLVCKETANELLCVLAYPKFKLTAEEQETLLGEFLPYAQTIRLPQRWPMLPACRDEKDQVFLVLAHVGRAGALITGDADLLAMRESFPGLIMTPEEWGGHIAS